MWNLSSLTRDWTHTPFIRRQSPFPRLSRKSQMDPSFLNLHSWLISLLVLLTLCYKTRFSSAQSVSCVWLFATPWTAARQASLFITNSRSLLKLMSIKSVMPSNHLILCRPLLLSPSIFPASGSFPRNQFFVSGGQSIGASASASVLPINTQDWFPLGLTGLISLQSKGLSRVFSNITIQKHQLFGTQLSL